MDVLRESSFSSLSWAPLLLTQTDRTIKPIPTRMTHGQNSIFPSWTHPSRSTFASLIAPRLHLHASYLMPRRFSFLLPRTSTYPFRLAPAVTRSVVLTSQHTHWTSFILQSLYPKDGIIPLLGGTILFQRAVSGGMLGRGSAIASNNAQRRSAKFYSLVIATVEWLGTSWSTA